MAVQRVLRPRTERGCVTGLRQLCRLAQVFPLVLSSHLLSGEIFVLDTRAVCTVQDTLPCTTQTRPLATSAGVDRPVCTMPGVPCLPGEGNGQGRSRGAANTVWEGCGSRPRTGLRPCWGPGPLRVSPEPCWALRQRSSGCTNEDPKDIFCNFGVWSLFEYEITQNVAWEACKMAAAGRGVHLLYQEDKTAAVARAVVTMKTKLSQHHVMHQGSQWCFKPDNPVCGEVGGACTMCTAGFANRKIRSLQKE